MDFELMRTLARPAETKIVLLVLDGLGGLPREPGGETELEAAKTPNMDQLAVDGICGLHTPVANGIIPGSGPAHQALFGYNPIKYQVGRGVLSALGIDFDLQPSDVAARGNFCTIDEQGKVVDRRAGRISTEENQVLLERLRGFELPAAAYRVETVKEYRFLFVLRGEGLSGDVADTDPHVTGVPPAAPAPLTPAARETAALIDRFVQQARNALAECQPANMILLRGFSKRPEWPDLQSTFGLRAAAIAGYPMYRGIGKLAGMQALPASPNLESELDALKATWNDYDFFFVHYKKTDSAGEDGDFDRKVAEIEAVDKQLPRLLALKPDVLVITGDHSTPAILSAHSWHPVPTVLWSPYCRADAVQKFGERACMAGGLGPRFSAEDLMPLMMANGLRLNKYGA